MDVVVYSEIWDRIRGSFDVDDLICVTGRVRYDEFTKRLGVTADDVWNIMKLRKNLAQYLLIEINLVNIAFFSDIKLMSDDLRIYQKIPVKINFRKEGVCEGSLYCQMKMSNELLEKMRQLSFNPCFVY